MHELPERQAGTHTGCIACTRRCLWTHDFLFTLLNAIQERQCVECFAGCMEVSGEHRVSLQKCTAEVCLCWVEAMFAVQTLLYSDMLMILPRGTACSARVSWCRRV
jgi:hypothetical protein